MIYHYKLILEDGTEIEFDSKLSVKELKLQVDGKKKFIHFKDINRTVDFTDVKEAWVDDNSIPYFVRQKLGY